MLWNIRMCLLPEVSNMDNILGPPRVLTYTSNIISLLAKVLA